jgi:hypothetical protein
MGEEQKPCSPPKGQSGRPFPPDSRCDQNPGVEIVKAAAERCEGLHEEVLQLSTGLLWNQPRTSYRGDCFTGQGRQISRAP